jgi:hypothetical protein
LVLNVRSRRLGPGVPTVTSRPWRHRGEGQNGWGVVPRPVAPRKRVSPVASPTRASGLISQRRIRTQIRPRTGTVRVGVAVGSVSTARTGRSRRPRLWNLGPRKIGTWDQLPPRNTESRTCVLTGRVRHRWLTSMVVTSTNERPREHARGLTCRPCGGDTCTTR